MPAKWSRDDRIKTIYNILLYQLSLEIGEYRAIKDDCVICWLFWRILEKNFIASFHFLDNQNWFWRLKIYRFENIFKGFFSAHFRILFEFWVNKMLPWGTNLNKFTTSIMLALNLHLEFLFVFRDKLQSC